VQYLHNIECGWKNLLQSDWDMTVSQSVSQPGGEVYNKTTEYVGNWQSRWNAERAREQQ